MVRGNVILTTALQEAEKLPVLTGEMLEAIKGIVDRVCDHGAFETFAFAYLAVQGERVFREDWSPSLVDLRLDLVLVARLLLS